MSGPRPKPEIYTNQNGRELLVDRLTDLQMARVTIGAAILHASCVPTDELAVFRETVDQILVALLRP